MPEPTLQRAVYLSVRIGPGIPSKENHAQPESL